MIKLIKIVLAVLLLGCLLDMPYGYYQLVRFVALIGFALLAYEANKKEQQTEMIIYAALALLLQPFINIALGREIWNILDVIVAVGLMISLKIKNKNSQ